ncbi:hypothetical protein ACU4GD_18415 [Cupriavidus basilensis]
MSVNVHLNWRQADVARPDGALLAAGDRNGRIPEAFEERCGPAVPRQYLPSDIEEWRPTLTAVDAMQSIWQAANEAATGELAALRAERAAAGE